MPKRKDNTGLRVHADEARAIIAELGGPYSTMRAMGISYPTVKRFKTDGCVGTNAAALRLAYFMSSLGVGLDWRAIAASPVNAYGAAAE